MAANFVPLTAALAARPQSASASGFAPVSVATEVAAPCDSKTGEVRVEVTREGERISRVRIHCRCGEVLELECEH